MSVGYLCHISDMQDCRCETRDAAHPCDLAGGQGRAGGDQRPRLQHQRIEKATQLILCTHDRQQESSKGCQQRQVDAYMSFQYIWPKWSFSPCCSQQVTCRVFGGSVTGNIAKQIMRRLHNVNSRLIKPDQQLELKQSATLLETLMDYYCHQY